MTLIPGARAKGNAALEQAAKQDAPVLEQKPLSEEPYSAAIRNDGAQVQTNTQLPLFALDSVLWPNQLMMLR